VGRELRTEWRPSLAGKKRGYQLADTENEERRLTNPLLDPNGPELGDDFLALCGERNRRFVDRLRAEKESERAVDAERLHRKEHPRIGVLAIQGDYAAHARALEEAGAEPVEVRTEKDLSGIDGLILPGGESTTMLKFMDRHGLFEMIRSFAASRPVFGTCAGAILLAREVRNPPQRSLGVLDAAVERNAYGRQIDSSIENEPTTLEGGPMEMVFIRAPRIAEVGNGVEVLAERDGFPVLVHQRNVLAATFHPELSDDRRVHRLFVEIVNAAKRDDAASDSVQDGARQAGLGPTAEEKEPSPSNPRASKPV
jgi:5'-phosphate synthase pdxT subunit